MLIQVVCAVLRNNEGAVLLTRRAPGQHLAGHWELPGGKLEADESPQAALERELLEELNLTAQAGAELCRNRHQEAHRTIELIALECRADTADMQLSVHDAAAWHPATTALGLQLAPADIPLLEHLAADRRSAPPSRRNEERAQR